MIKMKHTIIIILICCSFVGYSQNTNPIEMDIFLDKKSLKELSVKKKFINSIEYTPEGFLLLSSPNQFYFLGIGGLAPAFEKWSNKNSIESFTITSDSILVITSKNALYQLGSGDSFVKISNIPDSDMGITSKYDRLYVYDRKLKKGKKNYSIYQLSGGVRTIIPLVTIGTPILSVFERASILIFSTKNKIFSIDAKTKKMIEILSLPKKDDIVSIVGDPVHQALYFSTKKAVYRVRDNQIELVNKEFGGILRYDGEGLLVFNPDESFIVRFRNNVLYE